MKIAEGFDIAWWRIKNFYKWFTPDRFWATWRVLFLLGVLIIYFQVSILQTIGGFLINTDPLPEKADAIFAIPYERRLTKKLSSF